MTVRPNYVERAKNNFLLKSDRVNSLYFTCQGDRPLSIYFWEKQLLYFRYSLKDITFHSVLFKLKKKKIESSNKYKQIKSLPTYFLLAFEL